MTVWGSNVVTLLGGSTKSSIDAASGKFSRTRRHTEHGSAGQEERFPRLAVAYETLQDEDVDDPIATRAFERGLAMLVASARPPRRRDLPKRER
jgi:hypothetical protein